MNATLKLIRKMQGKVNPTETIVYPQRIVSKLSIEMDSGNIWSKYTWNYFLDPDASNSVWDDFVEWYTKDDSPHYMLVGDKSSRLIRRVDIKGFTINLYIETYEK